MTLRHADALPLYRILSNRQGSSMVAKFRTHCLKGHEFAGDNIYIGSDGGRRCRSCQRAYRKRRWTDAAYQEKKNMAAKNSVLKREYGLSLEEYSDLLAHQQNVCAICKNPTVKRRYLSVDHDHKTKKVRGLLCQRCNSALGLFGDNIEYLKRAV
jgi:hypothetical protein